MTGQAQLKSTQDALKDSEERFRRMYEKTPVPYLTLDENGCIQSINPAGERLLGYLKADVLGASFYDMLPTSDVERLRSYFSSINSALQPPDLELNVRRKDGTVVRVLFNGFQESDTLNKTHATFCILYDATEKL